MSVASRRRLPRPGRNASPARVRSGIQACRSPTVLGLTRALSERMPSIGFRYRRLQLPNGGADGRIQPGSAAVQMEQNGVPHAWVPELLDVLGGAGDGRVGALAREERADLIGHVDELLRRHEWPSPLQYAGGG